MHLSILDNLDLLVLLGLLVLLSDKIMRTSEESLEKRGGDRYSAWEGSSSHSIITRKGRREYNSHLPVGLPKQFTGCRQAAVAYYLEKGVQSKKEEEEKGIVRQI